MTLDEFFAGQKQAFTHEWHFIDYAIYPDEFVSWKENFNNVHKRNCAIKVKEWKGY